MLFLSIILTIGVITTFTDLRNKKIYNLHLGLGTMLGLIVFTYSTIFRHEHVLFHIINGLVALLIGFCLHRSNLWKGGDAKLFALFAFLMPVATTSQILFFNVGSLFACSFIAGAIILFPVFIKDILINRKTITHDLLSPAKRQSLFYSIRRVILSSWILFPFYYVARMTNPVIILTILYIFFSWKTKDINNVKSNYIIDTLKRKNFMHFILFILGLLEHLMLSPNSLSLAALAQYVLIITLSCVISTFIQTTFSHFKDYHDRVPFAPLLFLGCVLSYTPFLKETMNLVTRWNVLFYR